MNSGNNRLNASWWSALWWGFQLIVLLFLVDVNLTDQVLLPRWLGLASGLVVLNGLLIARPWAGMPVFGKAPPTAFEMLALAFSLLVVGSLWYHGTTPEGVFTTLRWLLLLALCWTNARLLTGEHARAWLARMAVLPPFWIAGYAVWQFQQINHQTYIYTPLRLDAMVEAGFSNPNVLSMALVLLQPFVWIVMLTDRKPWKAVAAVALLLLLATLAAFGSRIAQGVGFSMALVFTLFGILHFCKVRPFLPIKILRIWPVLLLIILLLVPVFAGEWWIQWKADNGVGLADNYPEALHEIREDSHWFDRGLMWHNSRQLIADHPFLGVGPGQWPVAMSEKGIGGTEFINQGQLQFMRPHNDFLGLAAEMGIVAGVLFLALLIGAIGYSVSATGATERSEEWVWAGASLLACSAVAVLAAGYFPSERPYTAALLALWIGVACSLNGGGRFSGMKKCIPWVLLVIGGWGGFWLWHRHEEEKKSLVLYQLRFTENWEAMAGMAQQIDTNYLNRDHSALPIAWYEGQALFHLQHPESALTAFQRAQKVHPYHPEVRNDLAGVYSLQGNQQRALQIYQAALETHPCHYALMRNLAIVHYQQEAWQAAVMTLAQPCFLPRLTKAEDRELVIILMRVWTEEQLNALPEAEKKNRKVLKERLQDDENLLQHFKDLITAR